MSDRFRVSGAREVQIERHGYLSDLAWEWRDIVSIRGMPYAPPPDDLPPDEPHIVDAPPEPPRKP